MTPGRRGWRLKDWKHCNLEPVLEGTNNGADIHHPSAGFCSCGCGATGVVWGHQEKN